MKTLPKQILIALTVLGMGSVSLAARADDNHQGGGHDWHQDGGHGHHDMGERMAHFQARLHDHLKLTAAQEPAWNAYVAAIKPQAPAAGAAHQDHRADWKAFAALPAPQKMEKMLDMQKKHEAMQEHHLAALKTFYATLTPDQQKTFDHSMMMGMHHRHHGRHHHWN
jgi:hypothetical protein